MPVPLTYLSICINNYKIKDESWHHFLVIASNLMMGNPRKADKSAIQNK